MRPCRRRSCLPGRVGAIAVGGGGRYIVFHFPEQGRLAVFDANVGDLTTSEGMENGAIQLAAGATKVVVSVPNTRNYRVYSLPELKRENEFEPPLFHGGRAIAMGSRTNGPLLCVDPFGHVVLMDIASGKPIEGSDQEIQLPNGQLRLPRMASCSWPAMDMAATRSSRWWMSLAASGAVRSPDVADAYPSADGNHLLGKEQIITTALRPIAGKGNATGRLLVCPRPDRDRRILLEGR